MELALWGQNEDYYDYISVGDAAY